MALFFYPKSGRRESDAGTPDITGFWEKCGQDGTMQKIAGCIPEKPRLAGLLGICFSLQTIIAIENNKYDPTLELAVKISF